MGGAFDLDVDTTWIRRAAGTLREAAQGFRGPDPLAASVTAEQLGGSAQASGVAQLVNLRSDQTRAAAAQLSSIAAGLADKLDLAADSLDRAEAATGTR